MSGERLTARQAAALRSEIEELEGPRRAEVVAAIKKLREFTRCGLLEAKNLVEQQGWFKIDCLNVGIYNEFTPNYINR